MLMHPSELAVVNMLKFHLYKGNDYKKYATYDELVSYFKGLGFDYEVIGTGEDGSTMYGLKYGEFNGKPVIFLDADCHGSEWQTSHFVLDFLVKLRDNQYPNYELIQKLKDTFDFYVIPSTNPFGYENISYNNINGVNLNRNTGNNWGGYPVLASPNFKGSAPFSEKETQVVRDAFNKYKPYAAVNIHTTTGERKQGIDTGKIYREYRALMNDIHFSSLLTVAEYGDTGQEWSVGSSPTFSGWYGAQTSKEGNKTLATILEARADQDEYNYGLSTLFIFCTYVYHFYRTGQQQIHDLREVI